MISCFAKYGQMRGFIFSNSPKSRYGKSKGSVQQMFEIRGNLIIMGNIFFQYLDYHPEKTWKSNKQGLVSSNVYENGVDAIVSVVWNLISTTFLEIDSYTFLHPLLVLSHCISLYFLSRVYCAVQFVWNVV